MAGQIVQQGCYDTLNNWIATKWPSLQMGLYKLPYTPTDLDSTATYAAIESSFPGYSRQPVPTSVPLVVDGSGGAATAITTPVAFTTTGTSSESAYGYFIVDVTTGNLFGAEAFASPFDMTANGVTLNVTPTVAMDPA